MTLDIIRRANEALKKGKTIDSYDLPKSVKNSIANRKLTKEQINSAYAKAMKLG